MATFLITDDDKICQTVLAGILRDTADVHIAENGLIALEKVKDALMAQKPYDAIFLDINMPEINGLNALKIIRFLEEVNGLSKAQKVIMTTTREDSQAILNSFKDQCDGYIIKPISKEAIVNKLAELEINT